MKNGILRRNYPAEFRADSESGLIVGVLNCTEYKRGPILTDQTQKQKSNAYARQALMPLLFKER